MSTGTECKISETAYLSSHDEYTTFSVGDVTIKFFTGKGLKKYIRVKDWKSEKGYLVVECENRDLSVEEDYIDLVPIMKNLYMDPNTILKGVREVRLSYVN